MSQWKSEAGPLQTKKVEKALRALRSESHARVEVSGVQDGRTAEQVVAEFTGGRKPDGSYDFSVRRYLQFGGERGARQDVLAAENAIGEQYGWTITRKNHTDVVLAIAIATATLMQNAPIIDKRESPQARAEQDARNAASNAEQAERRAAENASVAAIEPKIPAGAAPIVAQYERDDSHLQSDYHNTRTLATFVIGYRFGPREDFKQLRAAAERFLTGTIPAITCDGHQYGAASCVHGESGTHTFQPESGPAAVAAITEHRDNYSMGRGNYLSTFGWAGAGTGWFIRTSSLKHSGVLIDALPAQGPATDPTTSSGAGYSLTPSSTGKPGYVEVHFAAKPDEGVRSELKGSGFRWALRSACWYGPASALPTRYRVAVEA